MGIRAERMTRMATIEIKMLGGFEIRVNGKPVLAQLAQSRKATALVQYLVLRRGERVSHKVLTDTLWAGERSTNPDMALRAILHRFRLMIDAEGLDEMKDCIVTSRGYYQWNPHLDCSVDVFEVNDLSELALGWATYNGDHMSMYGVNAGVPKTLVRHLVRYEADIAATPALKEVLLDILDTPVSPELLPAKDNGEIAQRTEDLVGPYELHDFYLYYVLRFGFGPAKIFRLARAAFAGREEYPDAVLYKWLRNFYWRFFAQQFKRSCLPDGPKIGSVTLSPRGDWRMPSDACAALWLAELEQLFPQKDA
jgi:hypothetical protein